MEDYNPSLEENRDIPMDSGGLPLPTPPDSFINESKGIINASMKSVSNIVFVKPDAGR